MEREETLNGKTLYEVLRDFRDSVMEIIFTVFL